MTPCTDCGETGRSRLTRGVCRTCYSRHRRAGTLDQLPPPIISRGTCKRGHSISGDNLALYGERQARACRQCGRDRRRAAKAAKRAAKPKAVEPKPNPQPKAETPAKPKPVKAPKSKLPPGWDRVTPAKVHPKPGQAGSGMAKLLDIPRVDPLDPDIYARATRTVHLWHVLEPEVGCTLAVMLGLEDAV